MLLSWISHVGGLSTGQCKQFSPPDTGSHRQVSQTMESRVHISRVDESSRTDASSSWTIGVGSSQPKSGQQAQVYRVGPNKPSIYRMHCVRTSSIPVKSMLRLQYMEISRLTVCTFCHVTSIQIMWPMVWARLHTGTSEKSHMVLVYQESSPFVLYENS